MMPTYTVSPARRGGYALAGPLLPWTLRYEDETHAVGYAHHLCRGTGGRIVVLDSSGHAIITEHAEGLGWDGYGMAGCGDFGTRVI